MKTESRIILVGLCLFVSEPAALATKKSKDDPCSGAMSLPFRSSETPAQRAYFDGLAEELRAEEAKQISDAADAVRRLVEGLSPDQEAKAVRRLHDELSAAFERQSQDGLEWHFELSSKTDYHRELERLLHDRLLKIWRREAEKTRQTPPSHDTGMIL